MPTAEIIAIGTELVLGEIQDSNTRFLAKNLRNINVDLFRSTIIGDNANRISELIKEALTRADIVITSGGLGPTVDDPTRLAVANAVGEELEFVPELWTQILDRFQRYGRAPTENNRRQAYMPQHAIPVENPVGTAPAFIYETANKCVISLPGVPRELEYLLEHKVLPYLIQKYQISGLIKVHVLHCSGLGESLVDEQVADFELLSNPTVGLLAHPGQTDIRITAKAQSVSEAERMINKVKSQIIERLGDHIFGVDEDTLGSVVQKLLDQKNKSLTVIGFGLNIDLEDKLKKLGLSSFDIRKFDQDLQSSFATLINSQEMHKNELILGLSLELYNQKAVAKIILKGNNQIKESQFSYGGPPENASQWILNTSMDTIRRFLLDLMDNDKAR